MSNIKLTQEDYYKAEIIQLRKENEALKKKIERNKQPMCRCGHDRVYAQNMCSDCLSDYGL